MIRHVKLHNGLYYIQDISNACKKDTIDIFTKYMLNCKIYDLDIWYFILVHPVDKTIEFICKHFPYVHSIPKKVCDICHFAKQHRLPFQQSMTIF